MRVTKSVEERRQEIIYTAKKLFSENGFDKTMISDISKTMNVAQGLVYYYFKSKIDILYAIADEVINERFILIKKLFAEHKGSAKECLQMLMESETLFSQELEKSVVCSENKQGIIDYVINKWIVAILPEWQALIEKGNEDGSWNCQFPKESAEFMLYGFKGLFAKEKTKEEIEAAKQAIRSLRSRILGEV